MEITVTIRDRCRQGFSQCRDGQCIPQIHVCDRVPHCQDRSDEDPTFCRGMFLQKFIQQALGNRFVMLLMLEAQLEVDKCSSHPFPKCLMLL